MTGALIPHCYSLPENTTHLDLSTLYLEDELAEPGNVQ